MRAWESTRTPSLRKSTSCSIVALRNSSESPILSSSAIVSSCSVDWSLPKEPHGGRLRQQPLSLTHSRGHYPASSRERIDHHGLGSDFEPACCPYWRRRRRPGSSFYSTIRS